MAPSRRPQARAEAKVLHESNPLLVFPMKSKPSTDFASSVSHPVAGKISSRDIISSSYSNVAANFPSSTLRRKRPQWKPRPKMPPQAVEGCPIFDGIVHSVQWEKVLWKRQGYQDNFVPMSFLESLIDSSEPEKAKTVSIWHVASTSMVMAQNLSLMVLQGLLVAMSKDSAAAGMSTTVLDVTFTRAAAATLVLLGFSIWLYCGRPIGPILRSHSLRNLCWLPAIAVRMLAHIQNVSIISQGTSYICALLLAVIHFASFNYSDFSCSSDGIDYKNMNPLYLSSSHAAIGVILALHPNSSQQFDFQLYLIAFILFAVSPRLRLSIAQGSLTGHATLTALIVLTPLCALSVGAAGGNSRCGVGLAAFVAVLIIVCCIGPWGYVWAHRYKIRHNGPWEIAKVEHEHPSLM